MLSEEVIKWRQQRVNRRCNFCDHLRHVSCPTGGGYFECGAKDRIRSWFALRHIPRLWCRCYRLEEKDLK